MRWLQSVIDKTLMFVSDRLLKFVDERWDLYSGNTKNEDGSITDIYDVTTWRDENGKTHREGGPAVLGLINIKNGIRNQWWYRHGLLHREDGPAANWATTNDNSVVMTWYLNGKRINCSTQKEFEKLLKLKAFW